MKNQGLVRAMASMGGGIASSGGPCGALTGGVALLGCVFGKDKPEGNDDPLMQRSCRDYYRRFEEEVVGKWGSVNCRDIADVDWRDRDQAAVFRKGTGVVECAETAGKAARILGEVLEKYFGTEVRK